MTHRFTPSSTKSRQPKITYLVSSPQGHVPCDDLTCRSPLRLTRSQTDPVHGPTISFGQYFKAITDVISKDDYRLSLNAAARQLAKDVSLADIEEIRIYSEKHGSDYHPARIEVVLGDRCASFVMNVAVTARGRAWLCREFELLQYLTGKYDFPFLPRTYFQGEASSASVLMFLADWFQGYHEFHLSIDMEDGSQKLVLWDADNDRCSLSRPQAWQVYSQAAMILTLYYDPETFEQIFPWHHAAGDFIARARGKSMDIRLVTARQYASMLDSSEEVSAHEALLLFLSNLSVRMRLDRLDGVGPVAWADDHCVDATLAGFLEGLLMKQRKGLVDAGFVDGFLHYLQCLAEKDLLRIIHALIDACDQSAPDIPVVRRHLERHVSKFYSALQRLRGS